MKSLTTTGCSNNWLFTHSKLFRLPSSTQDLYSRIDPRLCADNAHASVLPHEMMAIEPGESPTRTLTWKSLDFLSHIKCRSDDDRFPLPLTLTFLIGPSQQCTCNSFHYDTYGDHLQTFQTHSVVLQAHDWVVYSLGVVFGSVGHKVEIHTIEDNSCNCQRTG